MLRYTAAKLLTKRVPILPAKIPSYSFASQNQQKNNNLNQWKVENTTDTNKTSHYISKNLGLSRFLTRTYNTTGLSVMGALSVGYLASMIPAVVMNPWVPLLVGGITSIASFISVNRMKYNIVQENIDGVRTLRSENSPMRLGVYALGMAGLGLSASPLFMAANAIDPSIIPTALGITCGIFGGASFAAYSMPKDAMIGYGRILGGSLLGLIAMQLIGLGSLAIIGPNAFASLFFSVHNYIGIGLFTAFVAYDTHLAIKAYESGVPDHVGLSIQFLLDFWNLLINVISLLGGNRD